MMIGSYIDLSLAKALETIKQLSARAELGYNIAAEKQERKEQALLSIVNIP